MNKSGYFFINHAPYFPNTFPIEAYFTKKSVVVSRSHKIKTEEQQTSWLNNEGNIINLFLVDAVTNILIGWRLISIQMEVAEQVKDILERQSSEYKNVDEVELQVANIQHVIPTDEMMIRTKMIRI